MFDGRDSDAAERLVDEWQSGFDTRAEQARELSARLARLSATARSADDLVTVTVGSAGDLVGLELGEGIRGRPAEETAREIVATLHAAQSALAAAVTEVTAETVGAESATGRAVIASYNGRLGDSPGRRGEPDA